MFFIYLDLQLAAELGKTLLERNKELEGTIKNQQNIIDDQLQEIEVSIENLNLLIFFSWVKVIGDFFFWSSIEASHVYKNLICGDE